MSQHPDLAAEQAYLDRAYEHLARMRARTRAAASIAQSAAQAVDSAIAQAHLERRLRSLDTEVDGLSFGRLDAETGDTWYVGRRHVEDERGDPVVVDWRAPISTPFYRATAADPMELARRRRFVMTRRHVDDLFDEVFDDPDSVDAAHHGGIPDPLLAELERSRTGEMRDIVATIAAEQDVVIRAELDTCLVVQGGPGTGKTAVGLHRAAFLLFEHRDVLEREGVLVVGPNPLFLRYIAQVLPSLGEAATRQTTIERLVGGRVRAVDSHEAARLKGNARLAEVILRGARQHLRPPVEDVSIGTPWGRLRLPAGEVRAAVEEIVDRGTAFSVGRTALRTRLRRMAWLAHQAARGDAAAPADVFEAAMRSSAELNGAVARIWPSLSAGVLVKRLLSNRRALAAAAAGLLDAEEQALLVRRGAGRLGDEPWTVAELVLVDEAESVLNGVSRTYGHVVVDEAQDLSAMELRAVARRCPGRSMTILGDLAQATAPAAQATWEAAVEHLGSPPTASIEELELGYRVPRSILDVANRLLPTVAPGVRPSRSVRADGAPPERIAVAPEDLVQRVAALVREQATAWGSVGVVVPGEERIAAVEAALTAAGVAFGDGRRGAMGDVVTVLEPPAAKGLEFDAVVVVEPAVFLQDGPLGGRLLYIALTRAVQRLTIVHTAALPATLAG
jgi:DNA helicase IV